METTNIISEYFDAQNNLNQSAARAAIEATRRTSTNICIRFYGLNEYDYWFNAGEIIEAGGLCDYLTSILDEPTAKEILNRDYEIVDTDDDLTDYFYGKYGTFDWAKYEEALEVLEDSWLEMDAFVAGLKLDIPVDKIQDAYVGEFHDDADYAEKEIGTNWEIPSFIEPYIDWEAVARGNCDSFHSEEKHYFLTNY